LPLLRLPAGWLCSAAMALRADYCDGRAVDWLAGGGAAATCVDLLPRTTPPALLLTHYFPGRLRGAARRCMWSWRMVCQACWVVAEGISAGAWHRALAAALSSVLATADSRLALANA
jgi:hypothetical protein